MQVTMEKEKVKKITFHVISHTHWDREWYLSFEVFRIELVGLIDSLLDILKQNKEFIFHLDGQTIILQDYLEIKPHKEEEIKSYIKSGNLVIGPWYVLSDQFLSSGESTIRNLLYGFRDAKKFGKPMMIGYCPDQFGQIAQLPQIFNGFNIHSAIVGRGMQDSISEHNWFGLNGDRVIAISLTHWYNNAQRFPEEKEKLINYLEKIYNTQSVTSKSGHILLMNGCDHLYPQKDLSRILSGVNGSKNWTLNSSNLENAVQKMVDNVNINNYPIYFGELRDDNNKYILAGTLSSRVYLKLDNYKCQTKLEKIVEPLSTLLVLNKQIPDYPYDFIKYAWKLLIQNQAHDSICGCSIDAVHKEMETRFSKVEQVLDKLQGDLLASSSGKKYLQLINLTDYHRKEIIEAELEFPLGPLAEHPSATPTTNKNKIEEIILKHKEKFITPEIVSNIETFKMIRSKDEVPLLQTIQKLKILFEADIAPFSVASYEIEETTNQKNNTSQKASDIATFKNKDYELKVNKDGTLSIYLNNDYKFENIHFLSIEDDLGDEYNFIPAKEPKIITSNIWNWNIKTIEDNSLRKKILLELNEKNNLECEMEIICCQSSGRIDFNTRVFNKLKNKRIRLHFPTGLNTPTINADTPFGVLQRARPPLDWVNYAYSQPLHNWIDHSGAKYGLAFFGGGLANYELYEDSNGFAVTLIRAIGRLSAVKSHSLIETPDAQCNREIKFSYSIFPHLVNVEFFDVYKKQITHNIPLLVNQSSSVFENTSLVDFSETLILSSFKRAEDKENVYILRLFNPTDKNVNSCKLNLNFKYKKAHFLNLNEEQLNSRYQFNSKGQIDFDAKPFEIITFGIEV